MESDFFDRYYSDEAVEKRRMVMRKRRAALGMFGMCVAFLAGGFSAYGIFNDVAKAFDESEVPSGQVTSVPSPTLDRETVLPETLEHATATPNPQSIVPEDPEPTAQPTQSYEQVVYAHLVDFYKDAIQDGGHLNLPADFVPELDRGLGETEIGCQIRGGVIALEPRAVDAVKLFCEEVGKFGYRLIITDGYRDSNTQSEYNDQNPDGAARAGESMHLTGFAFDVFMMNYGESGKWELKAIDDNLRRVARELGIVFPLAMSGDAAHGVVLLPEMRDALEESGVGLEQNSVGDLRLNNAINAMLQARYKYDVK